MIHQVSTSKAFYDLFFEISNEHRHGILLLLQKKAMRITDLVKEMDLNNAEIRRHISRLRDVGLIRRDVEGYYRLTPYGETSLFSLWEFYFLSSNSEYFSTHTPSGIPSRFVKRIGELSVCTNLTNAIDFFRFTENLFKESREYVWLLVDQFPLNSISEIIEAIERGVQIKIIEPKEREFDPDLDSMTSEETQALSRARFTPLVEQRMLDEVNAFLYLSEERCVLAFPTSDGQYDYKGFTATDDSSLEWCTELFQHYWDEAELRTPTPPTLQVKRGRVSEKGEHLGQVVVVGRENPEVDAQAVQDAVDNYDEVILRGTFNLGTSQLIISRSVVIRGEGREDDVPLTKVYKSGWTFPFFTQPDVNRHRFFLVDGEGADVRIENIHFTDFEYNCLGLRNGNSVTIRNNRITLLTGLGRGLSTSIGDQVIGIMQFGGFPGGVRIEGNYLDFHLAYGVVGNLARVNYRAEDPNFRPDLTKHNCYLGFGIDIFYACGKVIIENNIVRNLNARGIVAADNTGSAHFQIKNNTVISEIYGSYWLVPSFAGYGIKARSGSHLGPAPHVEISDNTIRCDKTNYCGIGLSGPELGRIGTEKLIDGMVKNNRIHLENGSIGIFTESCDGFEITDNTLTGKAYYGIGIFPGADKKRTELGAHGNIVEDNDMKGLELKNPDEYSKGLFDEKVYAGSKAGSATAHFWLNVNTKRNVVKVSSGETVVDEGEDNTIIREEDGE